ncbi:hypothetical protein [Streptosporangium pseudovulgare]|uniref:Uncharacterized protein n=1 Tax=Streptosporangium pseudovulgare TaxID=35765 RepID=A0ABQ2QKK7_9ACTN|nr:hypothetical protein [Streptosporangium pseudovulgare]GGP83568.1 hypothetical protein GCM10010140_10590 [Streptosporangium pseudovulgare]
MTITEPELREILAAEGDDGHRGGVTVADVDRRVRRIRRRRAAALGGTLAAGLAVVAALTLPGGGVTAVPDDVWTGVMAQPTPRYGARYVDDVVLEKRFSTMGERLSLDLPARPYGTMTQVAVHCPFGAELLHWEDGKYRNAQSCRELPADLDRSKSQTALFPESEVRRLEIAVVPPGSVRRLGRPVTGDRDARQVVADAPKTRADISVTVTLTRTEPCDGGPGCRFADEIGVEPVCPGAVVVTDPLDGRIVVVRCPGDGRDGAKPNPGSGGEGG